MDQENEQEKYISSLSEMERKALQIAMEHLGTSFDIRRSNGYQEWIKSNNKTKNPEPNPSTNK